MRYSKLSISSSPKEMNSDLEQYYGYGLYEFTSVIALISEELGIYHPYYKNNKIKGILVLSKNVLPEMLIKADAYLEAFDALAKQGRNIKRLTFELSSKKITEESHDYKLGIYEHGWDIILPAKTYKMYKKGKLNINEYGLAFKIKWLSGTWDILRSKMRIRDRIVGTWASVIKGENGIHWENISELLNWYLFRFPVSIQKMIGDPSSDIIKKQYLRKLGVADLLFDILRTICFPDRRKKPVWNLWFGQNYILWISKKLHSAKYNLELKANGKANVNSTNPIEYWKYKHSIALNELRSYFELCQKQKNTKPPLVIFPNKETFTM